MSNKSKKLTTFHITGISILAALSAILFYFEIPVILFYKLDFSNLPILLGTFAYGPLSGMFILLIKDLTGLLHSSTAGVGELADFLMSGVFVLASGLIYENLRTRKGALIGMLTGTVLATIMGVITNLYILVPLLIPENGLEVITKMGNSIFSSIDTPFKFFLYITAPFNILKGLLICVITFIVYKRLSPILHGTRKHIELNSK